MCFPGDLAPPPAAPALRARWKIKMPAMREKREREQFSLASRSLHFQRSGRPARKRPAPTNQFWIVINRARLQHDSIVRRHTTNKRCEHVGLIVRDPYRRSAGVAERHRLRLPAIERVHN